MIAGDANAPTRVAVPYNVVKGTARGDRDAILSIWREGGLGQHEGHADLAYDHARFEWFYLINPQGPAYVYLLTHTEFERPVGAMGIGPRLFSIAGVTQLGGTLVDFVTHPKHRSAYPALMLQRRSRELALESMRIVYGLPEAKAAAICRRLQSQVQFDVPRFVRVVRSAPYLSRVMPGGLATLAGTCVDLLNRAAVAFQLARSGAVGEWVEQFDERFDRLWSSAEKRTYIIGQRDAAFLRWRFGQQPARKHLIFVARAQSAQELRSYFVCEIDGGALVVKDCLSSGSAAQIAVDLQLLCKAARGLPVKSLDLLLSADERWQRALSKASFKRRSHRPFFATLASDYSVPNELCWYVTQADEDV